MARRAHAAFAFWLAALVVGCGDGGEPDRGAAAAGSAQSAAERLAEVAYWFRYEGALFGPEALEKRFARPGLLAALVADPAELSRFLAGSQYVVACADDGAAEIVYYGPWYRNLLVTRWSVGPSIDLADVSVVPSRVPEPDVDLAWTAFEPEERAGWEGPFERLATARRSAALSLASCAEEPAHTAQHGAPLQHAGPPLVDGAERGDAQEPLHDPTGRPGTVHRAIVRYFDVSDSEPLRALLGPAHPLLEALAEPPSRTQLAPLFAAFGAASERSALLVAYADLRLPGRYVIAYDASPMLDEEPRPSDLWLVLLSLDAR